MLSGTTLIFITLAMKGGSFVYYFENYVDKNSLEDFLQPILNVLSVIGLNFFEEDPVSAGFGIFNAGGVIFMIVGITLSKRFADRYGKRDVFGVSLFISTIFIAIFFLYDSKSVFLMFSTQVLHGFFYGITIPLLWAMIADVADYSEWKNDRRATAIIFSAMMVGIKGGLSIGSAFVTFVLSIYNYSAIENSNILSGQVESAVQGIKMLVSIFPSVPFFISVLLLFFYEINKNIESKIEKDLKEKREKNV